MLRATATRLSRGLHHLFEASLVIKGLLAAAEGLAGLGLLVTSNAALQSYVDWLTRNEIAQDPHDIVALWAHQAILGFSIQTQHFYALYLIAHGALKLTMVLALARRVIWTYPASVVLLSGFVLYQLHHWTQAGSNVLLVLSAFDCLMIMLILREYRSLKAETQTR